MKPISFLILLTFWGLFKGPFLTQVHALEKNTAIESKTPPNIILILADDLGLEILEAFGGETYNTPNLSTMAKNGRIYEYMHATPLCTPSRNKLLTGKSSIQNYLGFGYLNPYEKTLGHYFQEAGYHTSIVGKWQLAENGGMHPAKAGFDDMYLWNVDPERKGSRYWKPTIYENGKHKTYPKSVFGPDLFLAEIQKLLSIKRDKPFLLYYPMALPHTPFILTPDNKEDSSVVNFQDRFAGMVSYMDKIVGSIREAVAQNNLSENTIILFMGDNGTDRSIRSRFKGSQVPGGKALTTSYGIRVPLIIEWPGVIQPNTKDSALIDISTLFETLVNIPQHFQNTPKMFDTNPYNHINLYESWLDFDESLQEETPNFDRSEWIFQYYQPLQSNTILKAFVQTRDFKLYWDGRFYNIKEDIFEKNDLSTQLRVYPKFRKYHSFLYEKFQEINEQTPIESRKRLLSLMYEGSGYYLAKDSIYFYGKPGERIDFINTKGQLDKNLHLDEGGTLNIPAYYFPLLKARNPQAIK